MNGRLIPNGRFSILVVEDSPTQADQVVHILEKEHHAVSVARNGPAALQMLANQRPDIVISDIVMPEMDGYELCRRIRADGDLQDLPVILVTLLSDPKDVIRALQAGADSFIRKPYEERYLLSRVRHVMASRRLRATQPPEDSGVTLYFDQHTYLITNSRTQALDLLISTYEAAVEQNKELTRARDALRSLNENLEERVQERTLSLTIEIEKRKNAELLLQADRNLLRTVLDAIPDSICLKDGSLRFITANAAFTRTLHAKEPYQIAGKNDFDFFPEKIAEGHRTLDQTVIDNGVKHEIEESWQPNGNAVDLRTVRIPVRNDAGEVCGVLVIHWDITEQKSTERRLQQERNQLRTLIDNLPDIIYFKDTELRFVLSNLAHVRFLGLNAESELVGRSDSDFYAQELCNELQERERLLLSSDRSTVEFEETLVDQHGNEHLFMTSKARILNPDGTAIGLVGIGRDITERRALENRLEDLAKFPRENPNPVLRVSKDGIILYANESSQNIIKDGRFSSKGVLTRESREVVAACIASERRIEVEYKFGEQFYRLIIAPFKERDYVNIYGFDETEKKVLEQRLLQTSKMEAIGRLAGGVAHDFNNMMAVISAYSQFLTEKLDDNKELQKIVGKIKEAGEKASAITTQLLAFAHNRVIEHRIVDLNEIVAKLNGMLRRLMNDQITLRVVADTGLWPIVADATQMDQVVLNLVINARDAIFEQGSIAVETRNVTLGAAYIGEQFEILPGDYVLLSISDTGCGMDESTRAKIFEPFFTTKEVGVGTGLGLAIVYGVVRDTRGDIRVKSEPGTGTTFELYFPRSVQS